MICQHCGEEWNHASEDCPSHPGLFIDRAFDYIQDQRMLEDRLYWETVLDFEDEDN